MPPLIPQGSGEVDVQLSPAGIAAWQADKARPLTLRDAYLHIEGTMRVRFEREMYQANFTLVSQSLTNLQNRLRSITPSVREAPELLVHVPIGGEVEQARSSNTVFTQFLIGTINVREGADRDLGAVQQLTERVLGKVLQQVLLNDLEDKKRVAVLLGDHVTLSATVGEVRALSRQTREERDQQVKSSLDHWESSRRGEDREYKGSLGIDVNLPLVPVSVDTKLEGSVKKSLEQEQARRRQEALDVVNRGLDEVEKHFAGRIPTLSGIQFDQKGLASSLGQIELELKQNTFTTGWSHHEWPAVPLTQIGMQPFDPQVLASQLDQSRARYAEFQKLIDSPERLKAFDFAYARVIDLEKQLKAANDAATTTAMDVRKLLKEYKEVPMSLGVKSLSLKPYDVFGDYPGVVTVAFSPDGETLISSGFMSGRQKNDAALLGHGRVVGFWHVATGKLIRQWPSNPFAYRLAISPNCKHVAEIGSVIYPDGLKNRIYFNSLNEAERKSNERGLMLETPGSQVLCMALSTEGDRLVTGYEGGAVKIWSFSSRKELNTLDNQHVDVVSISLCCNGQLLATGGKDGKVRVWDLDTGTLRAIIKGHTAPVNSLAFSPDGDYLVTGSSDNTVKVWSGDFPTAGTGIAFEEVDRPFLTLEGHAASVNSVAFSHDNNRVASGSSDSTVRIWDAHSGQVLCTLTGHLRGVASVAFSPDDDRLASGGYDNTVNVWRIQAYNLLGMPKQQ